MVVFCVGFLFKQKTAYEMRISDWSSDVCSSDLPARCPGAKQPCAQRGSSVGGTTRSCCAAAEGGYIITKSLGCATLRMARARSSSMSGRSEEHTSELQSLMRISYAVFCLKKKN